MALVVARRMVTIPGITAEDGPTTEVVTEAGASSETATADTSWVVAAFVLVIVSAFVGWLLYDQLEPTFVVAAGFSAFAPLYILAQGIERLLEPFTKFLGSTTKTNEGRVGKETAEKSRNEHVAAVLQGQTNVATAVTAADWQAVLERIRKNTAVIAWGLASAAGILACGAFGIRLLFATGFDVTPAVDIFVSGLAVGSGTKPLHDLISNIQKAKDTKADPPQAATTN